MSGDNIGHGSSSAHDAHAASDAAGDIIPAGSWQDGLLALVCIGALVGFGYWANGFFNIAQKPAVEAGSPAHTTPAEPGKAPQE